MADEGLLADDDEVALDDVLEACSHAAATHRHAAERLQETPDGAALAALAEAREADFEKLSQALLDAGLFPIDPDPEREGLATIIDEATSLLSLDPPKALLEASQAREAELASAIETAQAFDLPQGIRDALQQMAERETDLQIKSQ